MSEVATLAGGCFWCLEAIFERVHGVERVESGFSGGDPAVTSYRAVCEGTSGHAEVVQVTFDPAAVSYAELLQLFFVFHDPTTLNRQGSDVGTQYRSAIFTHSAEQDRAARDLIAALDGAQLWPDPIVTEVVPFDAFFPAEDHHQGYYRQNARQPYCQATIAPKVAKLRAHFASRLKPGA
ncbi:MAG: peptide-methionine (S)-S-oxide reductase MsrA [Candidatus Eisenbacteria bacterium]|uniref:Peptide methionine sulfoxide reductase MsrA n=1 Tax=Eiseniibacteriota bacterium TaxID=2212470 RepID=A0A933SAR1_UNCEI|nr:peptide-methionine (S)-S-oxide reductase MsrA [Candidatus Eisenbacteria bacterium]